MADSESSIFHLALVKQRTASEQEINILNAFACGMQPATPETAAEAARQLDDLCPPLEQAKETKDYLWMVWEILFDIAASHDVANEIHERLMNILQSLRLCAKGDVDVWGVSVPLSSACTSVLANDLNLQG